jgi:uncharacterized protein
MSTFRPYEIKTIDAGAAGVIKDVDKKSRTVTGYFSTFGIKDSDGDIIIPTAFDKTIAERGPNSARQRIKHLWQHDSWQPIAAPKVLKADDFGLYFESTIAETTLGNDVLALYDGGVITEHSIGFNTILKETDESTQTNYIKEARLWEGSSVTWGANESTPFTGFKSMIDSPEKIERHVKSIFKALRNSSISDDTAESLEIWVNQLLTAIKAVTPSADNRDHQADVHSPDTKSGDVITLEQTADVLGAIFARKAVEQTFQRITTK